MSGTIGSSAGGPEPAPQIRGAEPAPSDARVVDATIAAYSASRDARSGERQVAQFPKFRDLLGRIRK